uniref:G-protein coupled receptors family 1 profile domain-containing protein n=1 Tax=Seriola dumerili TaxID=41447 RepID=A0A3B4TP07_SERDU
MSQRTLSTLCFFLYFSHTLFIIVANVGIAVYVFIDKNIHQPMYLLFSNLACVAQAFTIHMFSTTARTVLMIMAFDRYVAICNPLRYAAIMTNKMLVKLTVSAWGVAFVLVGILLGLTIRLNRCRTMIRSPYCDNAGLFKLSCESVFINNMYGLTFTAVLYTGSIGSMVLTYTKITVVCLISKNKSLNSKALKTCSTHLVVYLISLFSGMCIIILHRFPEYAESRKFITILYVIIPSSLNPIIYGMQSKEIRKFLSNLFQSKRVLSS